jgi:hypothetical protein
VTKFHRIERSLESFIFNFSFLILSPNSAGSNSLRDQIRFAIKF